MSQLDTDEPTLAYARGVGARIGAVNVSTLGLAGWAVVGAGIVGTLLIAASYLTGWLTISAESFGELDETASLGLGEAASGPMWQMYRAATLATIGCAVTLVFVPRAARSHVWLFGLTAAGLSLLTAAMATFVIGAALSRAFTDYGIDSDTPGVRVGYGWGMYAGYLGILGVALFIARFHQLAHRGVRARSAVTQ